MILKQIYSGNETVYQISSESTTFYRRYYKRHFGLFFLNKLYIETCRTCNHTLLLSLITQNCKHKVVSELQ